MSKKIRKGMGIAFTVWLGHIEDDDKKLAGFYVWRDFYDCNMLPEEAVMSVRGDK